MPSGVEPEVHEFEAQIEEAPRGGALIAVPFDAKEVLGSGRPRIVATFDGISYRGSIASMGGRYVLGVKKAIRENLNKQPGDTIRVTIKADTAPRVVTVPPDLDQALKSAGLREAFDKLSYTHQRENVSAIEGAKKPETRTRRIEATLDRLRG